MRTSLLLIAIAFLACSSHTSMYAEREQDRVLLGPIPDITPDKAAKAFILDNPSEYWLAHGNPITTVYVLDETNRWTRIVGRDQLASEVGGWGLDLTQVTDAYIGFRGKKYTIPNQFGDPRVVVASRERLAAARIVLILLRLNASD